MHCLSEGRQGTEKCTFNALMTKVDKRFFFFLIGMNGKSFVKVLHLWDFSKYSGDGHSVS